MNAYAHKLMQRSEGIWKNQGLLLEGKKVIEQDGCTSISLFFNRLAPPQAELLVSQMSKAFRRANVYWKEATGGKIIVRVEISPMSA